MIDFSVLSDDQLVELVKAACVEAVKRGQYVEAATSSAMLDEAEKLRIAQSAAEKAVADLKREEAERIAREAAEKVRAEADAQKSKAERDAAKAKQDRLWALKKKTAQDCIDIFGVGTWLTVWEKQGEKRIYIQDGEPFAKHTGTVCEYYCTGNSKQAPGSVKVWGKNKEKLDEVKTFCKATCAAWNAVKINCDEAINVEVA
jgi:hypothetical protein